MKLTIFPEVSPLPRNKGEKHEESKKAMYGERITIDNDDQLIDHITKYAWSPFIFHDNRRLADNFLSVDFLVFDIDEGLSIDECSSIVEKENLCCLCLPSPSHTELAPRFRVVLPLAGTISDPDIYRETWLKGAELFGVVDEQCKDLARFFFSCTSADGFWLSGELFVPVVKEQTETSSDYSGQSTMIDVDTSTEELVLQIYGEKREKIPEAVDFFIKNAHTGLPGKWINSINRCAFSLSLSGVDSCVIMEVLESLAPTGKLDRKDLYQIKRAIRDGQNA